MDFDLIKKHVYKPFTAFLYIFVVGFLLTACSDNDSSETVALTVSSNQLNVSSTSNSGIISRTVNLDTSSGAVVAYSTSSDAAWLSSVGVSPNTPSAVDIQINTDQLTVGDYVGTVTFTADGFSSVATTVNVTITGNGLTVSSGSISVTSDPSIGIVTRTVDLDTSDNSVVAYSASSDMPWLSTAAASGDTPKIVSLEIDTDLLTAGDYVGTVTFEAAGYSSVSTTVNVSINGIVAKSLTVSSESISVTSDVNSGIVARTVDLDTSNSSIVAYTVSSDATWLSTVAASGNTPKTVNLQINTNQLTAGNYVGTVTFTANGFSSVATVVNATINDGSNKCAPVECSDIRVSLPYLLKFDKNNGHLLDDSGMGTGFTYVETPSNGPGYIPANLHVNTAGSYLAITSTAGINHEDVNSQDNAVGVGFAGPNQVTEISTVLLNPPLGTGNYEQAGLWFGFNEDNYVKLVYNSESGGPVVEFLYEENGLKKYSEKVTVSDLSSSTLSLKFIADPSTKLVTAYYAIDGGSLISIDNFQVSPEMFSFDAAGIDPDIGTRSFTGLFATHRRGLSALEYHFDNLLVEAGTAPPVDSKFDFTTKSHGLDFPTSMVWGPNGKLYVTELFGTIHELTYDANLNVVSDVVISSLTENRGDRMTLGITIYHDTPSDPDGFSLWISSSSPSVDNGVPNSGTVTRLSGTNFSTVEDIITGLPRAKANHATNSLHFGPDDRLYIAVGGNTGSGAPISEEDASTEFGEMAEQPLSAAIIVADVFNGSFDGTCDNTSDIYGPPPCDVVTHATGLRNSYDFVFHSNGDMYATDNGLGVTGAFPAKTEPDCSGFASPAFWDEGGQNPGEQDDLLLRVFAGKYYGHPNPSRDECVFKDGSYQGGVPALVNYEPPLTPLGLHTSSNGIIEYTASKACGQFKNNLFLTNYSLGDNIYRVVLNAAGDAVIKQESLLGGFDDPLTLSQNNEGDLFVAEFGSGLITSVRINTNGCWMTLESVPEAILDSGSTALDDKLYMVGGKLSSGPVNTVRYYDPETDTWTTVASKPGSAVENPAVVAYNGKIYAFGGSTGPFSGAVNDAHVYTPGTNSWTSIASMPTARGGMRAEVIGGLIYVAGGMDASGASLDILEIYDPVANSWTTGSSMTEARDNAGTGVIDGKLYAVGGRERLADGTTINGTKNTAEVYDPGTSTWSAIASMPTGRRTMVVGTINGKLQVIGGEKNDSDPDTIFRVNEEYDPASNSWTSLAAPPNPRHGAAFATINGVLYVSGGGLKGGSSFTDLTEQFSF